MPLIETMSLCQRRDDHYILKNVNLRVDRGEVFALIGPTGAGKTTLLRLLDLIDTPASGKIFFDGVDTAESMGWRLEVRRRMAFILQKRCSTIERGQLGNEAQVVKARESQANNVQRSLTHLHIGSPSASAAYSPLSATVYSEPISLSTSYFSPPSM